MRIVVIILVLLSVMNGLTADVGLTPERRLIVCIQKGDGTEVEQRGLG
jgi:hypothetical protein